MYSLVYNIGKICGNYASIKYDLCKINNNVATNRSGLRITQTRILDSYIKGDFIEETQLQGLPRYTIEYVYVRVDNQLV